MSQVTGKGTGATDPNCLFDVAGFLTWLSGQCGSRSVTNDAQWSTAVDALTDAQLLLFLRAYIKKNIKVGVP